MKSNFKFVILALGLSMALAGNANASLFNFSEKIQNAEITGSFEGTLNNDLITNINNVSFSINNIAVQGNVIVGSYQSNSIGTYFLNLGGAVVSVSGASNNFHYMDSSNSIYIFNAPIPQNRQMAQEFNPLNNSYPDYITNNSIPTNWTVVAVPEPETYAMMLAGLALIGAIGRRSSRANVYLAA